MRTIVLALCALLGLIVPGAAKELEVAASIAPVHSLVAAVMGKAGRPGILIPGGQSPHTFAIRPSTARAIARAGLVFRISPSYEIGLTAPLSAAAKRAAVVDLISAPGVLPLPARDLDHGGKESAHDAQPTDDRTDARFVDPHVWLDPDNARAMVAEIARRLAMADPERGETYLANAAKADAWLSALDAAIRAEVAPVRARPYIVFHDGYQYFERRYGLNFAGAVTEMPGRLAGAAHVLKVREEIRAAQVPCVFAEPQFEPRLLQTMTEGQSTRVGVLDMLGAELDPGPELYFDMMRGLSRALAECLASR